MREQPRGKQLAQRRKPDIREKHGLLLNVVLALLVRLVPGLGEWPTQSSAAVLPMIQEGKRTSPRPARFGNTPWKTNYHPRRARGECATAPNPPETLPIQIEPAKFSHCPADRAKRSSSSRHNLARHEVLRPPCRATART